MNNNRFFTLDSESRELFYRVPKAFMLEDSQYFKMSPMCKLMYGILSDRNSLSIKNGWVDEQKRVYFLFNQKSLCKVLGIKDPKTLRKYLKELEDYNLLFRESLGEGLTDKLYLLQPEVSDEQVYKLIKSDDIKVYNTQGKNSLGGVGKKSLGVREKFPTNNNEYNNTEKYNNTEISSSSKDDDEISLIMKRCQENNLKLRKDSAKKILNDYSLDKILKAINDCYGRSIDKPYGYLRRILKDMEAPKTTNINIDGKKQGKQNFTGRGAEYYASFEDDLLEASRTHNNYEDFML